MHSHLKSFQDITTKESLTRTGFGVTSVFFNDLCAVIEFKTLITQNGLAVDQFFFRMTLITN